MSDQPEYAVNPEPLGRCPFEEDCSVVESPTHFLCERKLKEEESTDESRPRTCGFALPRTVCKREITRDEALPYLGTGKTELLTDFTSRFGRPFSATLVLRKTGRHGFEFPPRARRGHGASQPASGRRRKTRAKSRSKKPTRKPKRKKTARKKTLRKKVAAKRAPSRARSAATADEDA